MNLVIKMNEQNITTNPYAPKSINEGIIPMNMTWRASNQNFKVLTNINQQNAYQQGYEIQGDGHGGSMGIPIPNKGELYRSLVGEINAEISKFVGNKKGDSIDDTTRIIIQSSIKNKLAEKFGGYKKYLDIDFINQYNNSTNIEEFNGVVDRYFVNDCISSLIDTNKTIYRQQDNSIMINE